MNVLDDDWWTPLHTACSCDSVEVINLLLNVSNSEILMTQIIIHQSTVGSRKFEVLETFLLRTQYIWLILTVTKLNRP